MRSLLVFYVDVLGVDHAFIFLGLTVTARLAVALSGASARTWLRSLRRFIHLLGQLMRSLGQGLASLIHLALVVRLQSLLGVSQSIFNVAALRTRDLVAMFFQHLFDVVDHGIKLILRLDLFALGLVLCRMRISFFGHAIDFFLAEARRRRNRDLLVLAGGVVFRGHIEDSICVDIKRHLNLRYAA